MTRPSSQPTRPKILHVVDTLQAGGLQMNAAVLIAGTLDRFAHHVCCVRTSGIIAERLEGLAVPIAVLGKRGRRDRTLAWRIARHCRQLAPDIVHTRNWGASDGIIGARVARVPIVIHSEHGFDSANVSWQRRWSLWALSPFVDRMLTVSEDLRRRLDAEFGVPSSKVSLVRNGVDAVRFQPRGDRSALRRKHGFADDDLIVGVSARLDPIKNLVGLVRTFDRVAATCAQARLLIIGEGEDRERLVREIDNLRLGSRVRLVGYHLDVSTWLVMLDVYAYAPLYEGMPNGVLEAMATGVPVVSSRVGGLPEMVSDGVTGRLVAPGDTEAMAQAIITYCTDAGLRAAHGAAGRARAIAEFKPESMLAAYTSVYDGALAARHGMAASDRRPH